MAERNVDLKSRFACLFREESPGYRGEGLTHSQKPAHAPRVAP